MPFQAPRLVALSRFVMTFLVGSAFFPGSPWHPANCSAAPVPASVDKRVGFTPTYAFRDKAFTNMIADSYRQVPGAKTNAGEFYQWLEAAYAKTRPAVGPVPGVSGSLSLAAALDAERGRLAGIADTTVKSQQERQVAAWAHKTVKKAIPRFSLERGFEFYNMVHGGERQCYSQSILIAGMLQRAGIPAGVVMVWKSLHGEASNNGHAVAVAQLSNGRQLIVDASEMVPFPRQQGLFVRQDGQYRYVTPLFAKGGGEIVGYRRQADRARIATATVQTLDLPFLKSQFYYYRGERAPGGVFDEKKTAAGLSHSAQQLHIAVRLCPQNPLAVYMLGRAYQQQGNDKAAKAQFAQSYQQYSRFGYLPDGALDAFELVGFKKPQITESEPKQAAVPHG